MQLLGIQDLTQGQMSSVRGSDPNLGLMNHYTSCRFRKLQESCQRRENLPGNNTVAYDLKQQLLHPLGTGHKV